MFRWIRRIQRPIVALARQPSPNALEPPLMLSCFRIGPLTMSMIAGPPVVACSAYRFNLGSVKASTAAIRSGIYCGRQPAITALMAIFSILAGAQRGGTTPMTSCGFRLTAAIVCPTRSSVGGIIGNPSVQPFSSKKAFTAQRSSSTSKRSACSTGCSILFPVKRLPFDKLRVNSESAQIGFRFSVRAELVEACSSFSTIRSHERC